MALPVPTGGHGLGFQYMSYEKTQKKHEKDVNHSLMINVLLSNVVKPYAPCETIIRHHLSQAARGPEPDLNGKGPKTAEPKGCGRQAVVDSK
jgi:hypothetical protein